LKSENTKDIKGDFNFNADTKVKFPKFVKVGERNQRIIGDWN
jgi:hypothetical protein